MTTKYHFCQVIYDGQQLLCEYEDGEENGEYWLTGCEFQGVEIIEWLSESTISNLEKLIAEKKKELALAFQILSAA